METQVLELQELPETDEALLQPAMCYDTEFTTDLWHTRGTVLPGDNQ